MTAAHGTEGADQRRAGKREIADDIEHLVPDVFVGEPQPHGIDQPAAIEDEGIVERCAAREALAPQTLGFMQEAKCSRGREFPPENGRRKGQRASLPSDRSRKDDLDVEAEPRVGGPQLGPARATAYPDRRNDAPLAAGLRKRSQSDGVDRLDERPCRPVHRRDLAARHVNARIIDAKPGQRGEQMLGRRYGGDAMRQTHP